MGKKRLSKRLTLRHQHKIHKKRHDKEKKIRRQAKKMGFRGKRLKKDPGIPNLWPSKQAMLEHMQLSRQQHKEQELQQKLEKERLKDAAKRAAQEQSELIRMQYESMRRQREFEAKEEIMKANQGDGFGKPIKQQSLSNASKKAYYREFKKVVKEADVILEVLDARDPWGCRCFNIEKNILSAHPDKRIVLVLNKIDLVPQEVVKKWLEFLRCDFPTVAFKCSTQGQRNKLSQINKGNTGNLNDRLGGASLGAEQLLQLLKNYSRSEDIKKNISVGIIGYPNVGKSSLINSMKRTKVVGVGSKPGLTTSLQTVRLDKNISLLDCPGIIFENGNLDNDIILRNSVRIEQLDDPVEPVSLILKRCKIDRLLARYNIPPCQNVDQFLGYIAKSRGKLRRHGQPNLKEAAKIVLKDWNSGKIPFYTLPPKRDHFGLQTNQQVTWSGELNDDAVLQHIPTMSKRLDEGFIQMMASVTVSKTQDMDEDEDGDDSDIELSDDDE